MSDETARIQSAIDCFNAGHPNALDDMFARTGQRMAQIARRLLRRPDERVAAVEQTGDLVQEASIRLMRALRDIHVATPVEFLRLSARMMRRALLDLARHHYGPEGSAANRAHVRIGASSTSPGLTPSADTTHSPGKLAAWAEFHDRVDSLDDRLRTVFDLLWYQEKTQEEAAALLGVSVPTIKRDWREAKLALIEMLGDEFPETD
jgi:RNA polymerase sigma-70 factor (ECF subfamily)